tara:strand:+ start:1409 stop:1669 length:261 start_codon:yes stop_codon:yes gene_type:complete
MEITANLIKLHNEWIIAQVEPIEKSDSLPGDPDVWMIEPYVVEYDGQIKAWAEHSSEREFNVRSSDLTVVTNPSKSLLARYIESLE